MEKIVPGPQTASLASDSTCEDSAELALKPELDDAVVRILVEHHRNFQKFLLKRAGTRELADDLLQQSLLKALAHPLEAKTEISVLAWFYQVLRNTLIDHHRTQGVRAHTLEDYGRDLDVGSEKHFPALDEVKAELCQCLNALLPTLRPEYAEVIKQVDLDGRTPNEVAHAKGITLGNLHVRLHRARLALRKSLERSCGSCATHGCLDCDCGQ